MSELLKKATEVLDIKLSFMDMEDYISKKSEEEFVIHQLGKERFVIDYNELAKYYGRYKNRRISNKKSYA